MTRGGKPPRGGGGRFGVSMAVLAGARVRCFDLPVCAALLFD